jgi:leader peptidase (prepilin peptidase)/N-methyltransferase
LAVGFVSCLLLLTLIDLSTYLLPNVITYPLIVAGVAVNYFEIFASRESSLIGAVAGFSSFWLINALFKLVRGKEGMGGGDFKLFAAIGAWLGWQMLPLVMMLAACSGLAAALVLMCVRKEYINKIPFGPYLAAGAVLAMFYGPQISRLLIVG